MHIKVRVWLFLLFGVQGVMQVIYWEYIKGYPACFMCKGYRFMYVGILLTALLYRYRPRLSRLYALFLIVMAETAWSFWDLVQKIGFASQKCQSLAKIVDGQMVFQSCSIDSTSVAKVIGSVTGLNCSVSILMFVYALRICWKIRVVYQLLRKLIVYVGLMGSILSLEAKMDSTLRRELKSQELRAKVYEDEVKALERSAQLKIQKHKNEVESILNTKPTQEATETERSDIAENGACKGKCPTFKPTPDQEPKVQICMSFAVPAHVWTELNQELIKHEGVFVVKGLPDNSFQVFMQKVLDLRKQGITAPIQIDPKLFERLNIALVPHFVWNHEGEVYTASGTVTLSYVMGLVRESKGMTP